MSQQAKIVIVGAGPAGTAAAAELAKHGLSSTLIDENSKIGGVIYRGPLRHSSTLPHLDQNLQRAMTALHTRYQTHKNSIDLMLQTRVLGPEGERGLLLSQQGDLSNIAYDSLILATGCHERSVPFPGWQLPGVMLLGGVQLQLKSGLVRPGTKMTLVGTGPLLLLIACQLHKSGVIVEGVYEASSFSAMMKQMGALLNQPQQALNGLSLLGYLRKHKIHIHYRWGILAAQGDTELSELIVAPYNDLWQADRSRAKVLEVNAAGIGYGFTARSQLAQLMGLKMYYQYMNGLLSNVDEWLRSSNPDVYVAGDNNRMMGADAAICEGQLAALGVAQKHGVISASEAFERAKKIRKRYKSLSRFRDGIEAYTERKPGLLELQQPDTVVCRCEQVRRQQIDDALTQGVRDITSLKMRTRICMGDCQGKTCSSYAYDRLQQQSLTDEMGVVRPRFPLDPIPFAAMLDEE